MANRKRYPYESKQKKWRENINAAKILSRFQKYFEDDESVKLTANQIKVGEILLRKVMPDLNKSDVDIQMPKKVIVMVKKEF